MAKIEEMKMLATLSQLKVHRAHAPLTLESVIA